MKTMRPLAYLAALLLASFARPSLGFADEPASASALSDADRADQLLSEGLALGDKGDLPGARAKLTEALKLKPAYDIAANLGFVEVGLGAYKDGATHLAYAQRVFPPSADPKILENIRKYLERATPHLGALQLETEADAEIYLDGTKIGRSPLEARVFLELGPHELRVEKPGFTSAHESFEAHGGETLAKSIKLEPEAKVVHGDPKPVWPAVVLGSVGAVGIGVGIGVLVAGLGQTGDYDGAPCDGGDPAACPDIQDAVDQRNAMVAGGSIALAVGAAAAIGMTVYLVLPSGDDAETAIRLSPMIVPGVAGLTLSGRF